MVVQVGLLACRTKGRPGRVRVILNLQTHQVGFVQLNAAANERSVKTTERKQPLTACRKVTFRVLWGKNVVQKIFSAPCNLCKALLLFTVGIRIFSCCIFPSFTPGLESLSEDCNKTCQNEISKSRECSERCEECQHRTQAR